LNKTQPVSLIKMVQLI